MMRSANSRLSERPAERVRATFDQGVRAVKTWWRSVETPKLPNHANNDIDLTTEPPDPQPSAATASPSNDVLFSYVTEELDRIRRDVDEHNLELLHALERLAASYERVADRLESDRRERRMLAEAVLRLERRLEPVEPASSSLAELSSGDRVTGGWVTPTHDTSSPSTAAESATATGAEASSGDGANGVDPIDELFGDPVPDRY
jgi:hypothetical protein